VASVGVPLTVTLNVRNIGGNGGGDEITCVQVDVPSSFAVSGVAIVSVKGQTSPAVHRWQATTGSVGGVTRATFKNPTDDNPLVGLPAGDAAVFRITGTASGAGLLTLTGHAFDKPGSSGNPTCGSGTFPTIGITLSVAQPTLPTPTPAPTPPPTPQPTPPPTPKPTPTAPPTPAPTPTPTASPTRTPSPTLPLPTLPLPTLPLPTLPPPTVAPTPTPGGGPTATPAASTPAPSPSPAASDTPSAESGSTGSDPSAVPPGPASGGPGSGPAGQGSGSGGAGTGGGSDAEPPAFTVRGAGASGAGVSVTGVDLVGFDDIDWAVPALTLTVPGILLMLAVLAQLSASAVWLPFVRRWLGTFGFVGRRHRNA
jgi:hypothetical protein